MQTPAGIAGLLQGGFRGLESLAGRRRIEFGDQIALPDPGPLLDTEAGDGSGNREAERRSVLLLDNSDIDAGMKVLAGLDNNRGDPQGSRRGGGVSR